MFGIAKGFAPKSAINSVTGTVQSVLVLFFVLLLSACGGGGGGSVPGGNSSTVSGGGPTSPSALRFPGSFPVGSVMRAGDQADFFKVVGLIPNEDYFIDVVSDGNIGYNAYLTTNFQNPSINDFSCTFFSGSECVANDQGEIYLFAYLITPASVDIPYSIIMYSLVSEGSVNAAKDVTALLPYSATLPESDFKSYLMVGDLTAGNSYTIALSEGSNSSISLSVYQDNFQTRACLASSSKSCTQTAATNQLWVKVKGTGDYELTLTDNGLPAVVPVAEGTIASPQILSYTADGLLSAGQVDYTSSYYDLAGLQPGAQYRVVLDNFVSDNVDLAAYTDSSFTTQTCLSESSSFTEECVATADNTGNLWVRAIGENANRYIGANFDIFVHRFYENQGTSSVPTILNYSNGFSYTGEVDTYSYYLLDGLAANATYLLDLSNYSGAVTGYGHSFNVGGRSVCDTGEQAAGVLRCLLTSGDTGQAEFRVRESTSFIGSDFSLDISLSPYQSEGTQLAPRVLAMDPAGISVTAEVGGIRSYYRIDGLTPGTAYTIGVAGMLAEHGFDVYQDDISLSTSNSVCSSTGVACTRQAIGSSLWVSIGERSFYNAINGAALTITVNASPFQSEGSIGSPVLLTAGSNGLPYSSSVDTSSSFYVVDGLTPGTEYAVVVSNIVTDDNANLYVYDDVANLGSTDFSVYSCNIFVSSANTYCSFTPTGTSLALMMQGSSSIGDKGVFYDLDVTLAPQQEIVTIDASVGGAFPRVSSTSHLQSQYSLTNLLAKQLYYVSINNLTADIDLAVGRSSFSSSACDGQLSTNSETCLVASTAGGLLNVQTLTDKILYGAYFDLDVVKGPSDEGTVAAPVEILHSTAITSLSSQVGILGSFYKISGLTAGRLYEVDLTDIDTGVILNTHQDSAFDNISCGDFDDTGSGADLKCGALADITGSIYVQVRESGNNRGSLFNLQIKAGLLPEGSVSAGLSVVYNGGVSSLSGQVDLTDSYYEVSNLDPKIRYIISVTGMTDNTHLYVYDDAAYSNQVCSSQNTLTTDESCGVTMPTGGGAGTAKLYVKVNGARTIAGALYTLDIAQ